MDRSLIEDINFRQALSVGLEGDYDRTISMSPTDIMIELFSRRMGFKTGHSSDIGKLPWHPTFSNESAYSSSAYQGGQWSDLNLEGASQFTPSLDMLKTIDIEKLKAYFLSFERGNNLNISSPYR